MQHDEGTFRGLGGLPLYYQRWLPAQNSARAVLAVVHGIGEHSGRYGNVVNYFVPRGFAVYACDLRGHGRSPGKRGHITSWAEYREDVHAFLTMVNQQEPGRLLFLFGHSMGGLIVLDYALSYPSGLRGVIASAPVLDAGAVSPLKIIISRVLSRIWPSFSWSLGLDLTALSRDAAVAKAYRADPLCHGQGTARWGTEIRATMLRVQTHAADLRVPLLIVHGSADRIAPAEAIRRFFVGLSVPDRERYEYSGGYHELHNDLDSERVFADIEEWVVRRISTSTASARQVAP